MTSRRRSAAQPDELTADEKHADELGAAVVPAAQVARDDAPAEASTPIPRHSGRPARCQVDNCLRELFQDGLCQVHWVLRPNLRRVGRDG